MLLVSNIIELKRLVKEWKRAGKSIGLVPTMGFLHEGHVSLIHQAVKDNDMVIVSDFVNPIQFGKNEDLSKYPRDLGKDLTICDEAGAHILFAPTPSEMYHPDFASYVDSEEVSKELCGKSRPNHFRGVCTVCNKLFNITEADRAYFGKKDAQQLAVIRRMVRDLNMNIEIIGCPIIREQDGLAKSSRNVYLNKEERKAAGVLHKALALGEQMIRFGETDGERVLAAIRREIEAEPLAVVDYIEMVSWDSIQVHHTVDCPVLVAVAVYIGKTRLIDNFIIE